MNVCNMQTALIEKTATEKSKFNAMNFINFKNLHQLLNSVDVKAFSYIKSCKALKLNSAYLQISEDLILKLWQIIDQYWMNCQKRNIIQNKILKDESRLDKTVQCLQLIMSVFDLHFKRLFYSILVIVSSSLINTWIKEFYSHYVKRKSKLIIYYKHLDSNRHSNNKHKKYYLNTVSLIEHLYSFNHNNSELKRIIIFTFYTMWAQQMIYKINKSLKKIRSFKTINLMQSKITVSVNQAMNNKLIIDFLIFNQFIDDITVTVETSSKNCEHKHATEKDVDSNSDINDELKHLQQENNICFKWLQNICFNWVVMNEAHVIKNARLHSNKMITLFFTDVYWFITVILMSNCFLNMNDFLTILYCEEFKEWALKEKNSFFNVMKIYQQVSECKDNRCGSKGQVWAPP